MCEFTIPAPWQGNYWNVSTESLLKIVVAVKITEAYNSEAPKFPLFVYNHARVFSRPIRSTEKNGIMVLKASLSKIAAKNRFFQSLTYFQLRPKLKSASIFGLVHDK